MTGRADNGEQYTEWLDETAELPRLRPGEWNDELDEEPAGWYAVDDEDDGETGEIEEDGEIEEAGEIEEDGEELEEETEEPEAEPLVRAAEEPQPGAPARHSILDAVVWGLAAAIVLAVIGGGISYAGSRRLQEERTLLASVGDRLPGEQALNTVSIQKLAAIRVEEDRKKAEEEERARKKAEEDAKLSEEEGSVEVEFSLSTIQSDLKVKVRRKKEQSLIGGVPFRIRVKGPGGKTMEKTDDDEDGIFYLSGLSNGKYEVTLCPLLDLEQIKAQGDDYREDPDYRSYSRYRMPETAQTIEVSDHIAYEVVDVADEIKSASEVNVAKEDTAKKDTPVESVIRDTVEWVESTKTEIGEGGEEASYIEVKKSEVPDPYLSARVDTGALGKLQFRRLSSVTDPAEGDGSAASSQEGNTDSGSGGTQSGQEENSGSGSGQDGSGSAGSGNSGSDSSGSDSSESSSSESGSSESSGQESSAGSTQEKTSPSLTVDPSEIHLTEGKTQSIHATVSGAENASVTYSSTDEAVAVVSDGGTVQAKGAGSCEIRVGLREYSEVTKNVKVTVSKKADDSAALKDSAGNPLYVKEQDAYRAATAADYSKYDVFYRKTAAEKKYRYTGWQHINGLTYYYDKDGNYVTGSQIIQGVSYTFSSEGILSTGDTRTGIDVSVWNGRINWNEVAASGISFAIVRCGYRGSSAGMLVQDSTAGTNITGAKNAGLKVGLYFFSQAVNEAEAVEEASMAVQMAKNYGISLPIFLDVESSGGRGDAVSVSQRTANIAAFCRTVQNAGFSAGVYANTNWFSEKINTGALTSYHIWLAQYAAQPTYSRTRYDIWQYSSTGKIAGISGDVDLNISYRAY